MATISNNDIKIRYVVDADNIQRAAQTFDNLTEQERQALAELKKFNNETKSASAGVNNLGGIATKVGGAIAAVFAVDKIVSFGKVVVETTAKFQQLQKAIDFASGSTAKGAENFQFLKDLTSKLGLDLMSAAEGYKTFAASSNLAGVSIKETNRQFEAVSKAVAALGLSSEDAKGVFLALGQIISKGTVASEELRGQIGERLPGAFNIAAKAMGVTTMELGKMLQKGEVASKDFLPKFATELENAFGASANANLTTLTASQNKFNSAIDGLILAIGNKLQPFLKGAYDLAAGIANQLANAGGGSKAKQQSIEQLAAKKAESDIGKKILDTSIKQGVWIERRKAATLLLLEINKQIDKALNDGANARIAKDKIAEQNAKRRYDILVAEEEVLTKIAGITITAPTAQPEKTQKELKAEYDLRMQLLELERQQLKLLSELRNQPLQAFGAEKVYAEKVYQLKKEYLGKNIGLIEEEVKTAKLNAQVKAKDYEDAAKKEFLSTKNWQDQADAAKKKFASDEDKRNEDAKKRMADFQKNYEENLKKQIEKEKEAARIKEEIKQKAYELGQEILNGGFDLYQRNLSNELTLLQRRYDEEIRLADGNQQKLTQIEEKKRQEEKDIKTKQFRADQAQAIANVLFRAAPEIIKYAVSAPPLAAIIAALAATQTGLILAQPVPEFAEGTKGKPFEGGAAIVGERGVEKVVTKSGKVYFTPDKASLVNLPKGSEVVPHHQLTKQELFMAGHYANKSSSGSPVVGELRELGSILKGLPMTQINMDERGFEKFIRTPRRTTKILNNRFRSTHE